jgi:16S rRNA processing protein RimM
MNTDPNRYVILGQVVGVFGIKGWVRIQSDTEPSDNILTYSPWYLARQDDWQAYKVLQGQAHSKGIIALLEGCHDRDMAASLVGCRIAVTRNQLPTPAQGEYYWSDLIGLDVYNLQQEYVGKVTAMLPTGANDVLVIQGQNEEILIPYVKDYYVYGVDLAAGKIAVDWDLAADDEESHEE